MRRGQVIQSNGESGYLIFGPHLKVDAGRYEVKVLGGLPYGDGHVGHIDVATEKGNHVLASAQLRETIGSDAVLALLRFVLVKHSEDLEFRIWLNAPREVELHLIEIAST